MDEEGAEAGTIRIDWRGISAGKKSVRYTYHDGRVVFLVKEADERECRELRTRMRSLKECLCDG